MLSSSLCGLGLVEHIYCGMRRRRPLCVAGVSVRYFETLVVVSEGHEERNPALMATSRVALVEMKRAACMNCMVCWRHFVA